MKGGEWGVMEVERRGNNRVVGDGERKKKKRTSVVCRLPHTVASAENVANQVAWLKYTRHVYNMDSCHIPRVESEQGNDRLDSCIDASGKERPVLSTVDSGIVV